MNNITPFYSSVDAIKALDNGGRFYNLFTKAEDGVISKSELARTGGVFSDHDKMMLYLEMSLSELGQSARENVLSHLDDKLHKYYLENIPAKLSLDKVQEIGAKSQTAIISGEVSGMFSKSDSPGFIIVPVMIGSVPTYMMSPITDQYIVYPIQSKESDQTLVLAYPKGKPELPTGRVSVGGVLKELYSDNKSSSAKSLYMEAAYYIA
jgi:hypothetical protein